MEAFPIFSLFRLLLLFIFYSFKTHKTQIMQHKNKTVMVDVKPYCTIDYNNS